MKLVSRVNAIINGKDNPGRKPDQTVCRFGLGLATHPVKKDYITKVSTIAMLMPYVPLGNKDDIRKSE